MKENQKIRNEEMKQRRNDRNKKSNLKIPKFNTRKEFIDYLNTECKDY